MDTLKSYRDIILTKDPDGKIFALNGRNLQLASGSSELWDSLPDLSFEQSCQNSEWPLASAISAEVNSWLEEPTPVPSGPPQFAISNLTINVTQICNLHCQYCAAGGDGTYGDPVTKVSIEKTLPQVKFFLEQRRPGENFHLAFLGGEPFLYPEAIHAIASYAQRLGRERQVKVTSKITTNGTLIDKKAIALLSDFRPHIVVSLDGSPRVNDQFRPTKSGTGSTQAVLRGLELLAAHPDSHSGLGVHAVFTEKHTDVLATYDFFRSLPVDWMEFTFNVDQKNDLANREYCHQLEKTMERALQIGGEKELRRIANFDHYFKLFDRQTPITNHCGIGKSLLVIDSRNQFQVCPWTVGKKEGLVGGGLELNYDKLSEYQSSLIERNNCQSCWARNLCGGGCSYIHGTAINTRLEKKADFCYRTRYSIALAALAYGRVRNFEENTQQEEIYVNHEYGH